MRQHLYVNPNGSERFRRALRSSGASAVIHRTEGGLLVELSNGRMCSISHDAFGPATNALTALKVLRPPHEPHRHGCHNAEV